jgi:glycosyltransferase involved in cell wall biosynthesis
MTPIAIIEPCHSHEEVILPQVELLRNDFNVHVVAPPSLLNVDLLRLTSHLYQAHPIPLRVSGSRIGRLLGKPSVYRAIRQIVDTFDPAVLIFNSTYSLLDVVLIRSWFRDYRKIQIIHNLRQFLMPGALQFYRAFDANLVISEQVHQYATSHHPAFSDLRYFLPIYFDSFLEAQPPPAHSTEIGQAPLKLGVFGAIEEGRRNYRGLMEAVRKMKRTGNAAGFRIYLVGRAPGWVQELIRQHDLQGLVEHYTEFVPFREMFEKLAEMDIVLFLVDNEVGNARHYNRYKISGTSTLIKAFRKACACSTDFPVDDSLADKSFYYEGSDIGSLLKPENRLLPGPDAFLASPPACRSGCPRQRSGRNALTSAAVRRRD